VAQLEISASLEDLLAYLLQLVQALRYEPRRADEDGGVADVSAGAASASEAAASAAAAAAAGERARAASLSTSSTPGSDTGEPVLSCLAEFLNRKCLETLELCNFYHWFLTVEAADTTTPTGAVYSAVHRAFLVRLAAKNNKKKYIL
jgi:hypothetical protein